MKRILLTAALLGSVTIGAHAQRVMDKLDRGLVAVPGRSGGNHVSWRKLGEEYYDTKYRLYRDGVLVTDTLTLSNYEDRQGNASSRYQVQPIVNGVVGKLCSAVQAWDKQYMRVTMEPAFNRAGVDVTAQYEPNDISVADVDGDGSVEFMLKRNYTGSDLLKTSNKVNFHHYEVFNKAGKRLWWIDLGPNMMAGPDEQWDMIGYDWDGDGKAEALMRGADNMIIHTSTGETIEIGDMNYDNGGTGTRAEYTHDGAEYLLYLNGETGVPYGYTGGGRFMPPAYPLPRYEAGESDYGKVWGRVDTGHRATKHYFGAPYLDGVKPSIFLSRGCYTQHKMCALDVNPTTHELTQRWRWYTNDSKSPWYGNGFHNFQIADVDMDGRDEIVIGSMVIDDDGHGLSTTGLGHGDAQHCGDLDPYRWGLEQFTCQEGSQGNSYWNATTGQMYYRKADGGDDGRSMAGNFTNDYPGGQGRSVSSGIIGLSSDKVLPVDAESKMSWGDLNMRIYWDGDLLDELFNSPGVGRVAKITKWGNGRIYTSPTGMLNNASKNNPCFLGDIFGDWREEFIVRSSNNTFDIYETNFHTDYSLPTLWVDHEYRNAMAWQAVGYNQPPHPSFFLGEKEGITMAPPPVMLSGRKVIRNGETITTTKAHLLLCEQGNMSVSVANGASPWIVTDNAPAIVQGTGRNNELSMNPTPTTTTYTHTLTGGAFAGATRLVKQGEGTLVLPTVVENYTGNTDIWNGTLQFDGTLAKSHLWLNRHTTLLSDGGQFKAGIKACYNATIFPGGRDHCGTVSTNSLELGIGARVVFDLSSTNTDRLNANTLAIETKDWGEYGPKYKAPVFQFNISGVLPDGNYSLGKVGTVQGAVSDIIIEGIEGRRAQLKLHNGELTISVETLRSKADVVWNGTTDAHEWDFGQSENFLLGNRSTYSAKDDRVTFTDAATVTDVIVKRSVRPSSITFANESKAYTLTGDSILGDGIFYKNGAGHVTIGLENHIAKAYLNKGRLTVASLANLSGVACGALGTVKTPIHMAHGTTLAVNRSIITDQPFFVGGTSTLHVPAGLALTLNTGIVGSASTVVKEGPGTLTLGVNNRFDQLQIDNGTVWAVEANGMQQLPKTVVFNHGTLYDAASENIATTNATNFVVPEGKSGTFYGDPRCDYTGTLTGKGTFTVYGTWVRCYYKGDWSRFEGTVIAQLENRSTKHLYNAVFDLMNTYGLPKATLSVPNGVTVTNHGLFEVGTIVGEGTLAGSGPWVLGSNGSNFRLTTSSTAPIIKRGAGTMAIISSNLGRISNTLSVAEGCLRFNDSSRKTLVVGTNLLSASNHAVIEAQGLVQSLTLSDESQLTPCAASVYALNNVATVPGTIESKAQLAVTSGAAVNFLIDSKTSYSKLLPAMLTLNGKVRVIFGSNYQPANGDVFTLWSVSRTFASAYTGKPTLELPVLPAGLYWDTRELVDASGNIQRKGVLRVSNDPALGISGTVVAKGISGTVYTLSGVLLGHVVTGKAEASATLRSMGLPTGTYIVKTEQGSWKVTVR